jgi:hypothetical protein
MRKLKQKLSWIILIALFSAGVVGVAINRAYTHASSNIPAQQNPKGLTALPFALRMNGFAPEEITRPAGNYLISVTNLTGMPELTFKLDRANGERVHSAKVPKEKRTWRQQVHLTPGDYLLTVMDHPDWSCRITITAQ